MNSISYVAIKINHQILIIYSSEITNHEIDNSEQARLQRYAYIVGREQRSGNGGQR
jgi:hypothetical protein